MTNNKPNDVRVVPVELLERVSSQELGMTAEKDRQAAAQELRAILAQPADQQGEPVRLTAVAVLREDGDGWLQPEWLLEGGTAELWDGALLIVADEHPELCEEDGSAELYRHAQPATAKVDERVEFEKQADRDGANLDRGATGCYENPYVESSWEGWQARANLSGGQS